MTPRFAPTCPEDQLASLGQLASKYGCHIQSHLCETQPECNWVKELFPWAKSYTDVYDSMRLLSEKVICFDLCVLSRFNEKTVNMLIRSVHIILGLYI